MIFQVQDKHLTANIWRLYIDQQRINCSSTREWRKWDFWQLSITGFHNFRLASNLWDCLPSGLENLSSKVCNEWLIEIGSTQRF